MTVLLIENDGFYDEAGLNFSLNIKKKYLQHYSSNTYYNCVLNICSAIVS